MPLAPVADGVLPQVDVAGALLKAGNVVADASEKQQAQARQAALDQQARDQWRENMNLQKEKVNQDSMQWSVGNNEKEMARQWEMNPENPKNKQIMKEMELMDAKIKGLGTKGTGTGPKQLTTAQAIGLTLDAQKGKWEVDPVSGEQVFRPAGQYSLPDSGQFAIEDAMNVPRKQLTLPGDSSRDAVSEAAGMPDWLRQRWYGSKGVRVPATRYFKRQEIGSGGGLGLDL
jgi:hypothetical protein